MIPPTPAASLFSSGGLGPTARTPMERSMTGLSRVLPWSATGRRMGGECGGKQALPRNLCLFVLFRGHSIMTVRITHDGGFKQHLQWSPDGTRFLLTRIHQGQMAAWVMNADGSDLKR